MQVHVGLEPRGQLSSTTPNPSLKGPPSAATNRSQCDKRLPLKNLLGFFILRFKAGNASGFSTPFRLRFWQSEHANPRFRDIWGRL